MADSEENTFTTSQPALGSSLANYLDTQAEAFAAGLAIPAPLGDVIPHDALTVQPIDARLAWKEARVALECQAPPLDTGRWKVPPEWTNLVATQEPVIALPFCAGNYPQKVRSLTDLIRGRNIADQARTLPSGPPLPALRDWALAETKRMEWPQILLVIGTLRIGRQFDLAAQLLQTAGTGAPKEWEAALTNEEGALAWHTGDWQRADTLWKSLPPSAPVFFNQGLAALFLDHSAKARPLFEAAKRNLSEATGWLHLANLYSTFAGM